MFGLRCLIDSQNLRKNGQPPHSTTGVASAASSHGIGRKNIIATSGIESAALTQSRRVRSRSSESSSGAPSIGTSAIPHFGHEPGPTCTISGCIGQVYLPLVLCGAAADGGFPATNLSGFALKACRQCCEQKW